MSKNRLTKKQLRTDELEHALVGARDYVVEHQTETKRWAIIGVAALVLVGAVAWFLSYRSRHLGERLSEALALLDAPLVTEGTAAPGQRVFKDDAERLAAAKKDLKALADDSASSTSGRAANLVLLSLEGSQGATGTRIDAVKSLANKESGSVTAGIAAITLIQAQAAAGRVNEAIDTAKRYLESSSNPLPKDVLIFTLAELYERSGKPVEARTFYQRVVTDFPDSLMKTDAQQKVAGL